jgi:hypothetical protein
MAAGFDQLLDSNLMVVELRAYFTKASTSSSDGGEACTCQHCLSIMYGPLIMNSLH